MRKEQRQAHIKEIIENHSIETQEELTAMLRQRHIDVTQATISRDIKELLLVKVPAGDGRYRYAFPADNGRMLSQERMTRMFRDSVTALDDSENIIVVRTLPGTANAVASVLDSAKWQEIIGTVAGDDSIIVVVKPKGAVPAVLQRLTMMMD